jgi:hypothetical protein
MTTAGEEPGQRTDRMLDDIVRDAGEYFDELKAKHVTETRIESAVVGVVVWFASFAVLGIGAITTIQRAAVYEYLFAGFLVAVVIGAVAGLVAYFIMRRRAFKFAELGQLLKKMKAGTRVSTEDGLRLMDAIHKAALVARKSKLDSAFAYGVGAFALVVVIGQNAGIAALAGVVVYLYFRFEALRHYEKEDNRFEDSKKELLQSL